MAVPAAVRQDASGRDASSKRKPYVMSKPRETWSAAEHNLFVEALSLYTRDWKKIQQHVNTKTAVQIRSHAQKYFQKQVRNGNCAAVPPPRPKRQSGTVRKGGRKGVGEASTTLASAGSATPRRVPAEAAAAAAAASRPGTASGATELSSCTVSADEGGAGSCSGGAQSPDQRNGGALRPQRKVRRTAEKAAAAWRADSEAQPSDRSDDDADTKPLPAEEQRQAQQQWLPAGHFGSYIGAATPPDAYAAVQMPYQTFYPGPPGFPAWQQMCQGLHFGSGGGNPVAAVAVPAREPPNFPVMYRFLGSLFDGSCSGLDHSTMLSDMSPATRETATHCLQMLVANMQTPGWQALHNIQQTPLGQ